MSDVGLGVRRDPNDKTWRQTVERVASRYGLQSECLYDYDEAIANGSTEENAAWSALYNWDVLDLYVDGKPTKP